MTSLNVMNSKKLRPPKPLMFDSEQLDRFDLDESVQNVVQSVNANQGFRILGWFKPAQDEDGTAVENKRFHVCCLIPETDLEMEQFAKKYFVRFAGTSSFGTSTTTSTTATSTTTTSAANWATATSTTATINARLPTPGSAYWRKIQ